MNSKTIGLLGVIAAVIIIAAIMIGRRDQPAPAPFAQTKGRLFPVLSENVNNVTKVLIQDGDSSVTLTRGEKHWGLDSKFNYPVQFEQVRKTLVDIANMEKVEAKTSNPANYERLQVHDPRPGETLSRRITMWDASGKELASVIIGKSEFGAGEQPHQYVRPSGQKESWLVKGNISVNTDSRSWLETDVANLPNTEPRLVRIEHVDGEAVVGTRPSKDIREWKLESLPEGMELKNQFITNEFARILEFLRFDEVRPADQVPDSDDLRLSTTTVETFDGKRVVLTGYDVAGEKWFKLTASANEEWVEQENARREQDAKARAEAERASQGNGDAESAEAPKPELVDLEATRKKATEMNEKTAPWAYKFPTHISDRLTRRNEFYAQIIPPKETPEQDAGAVEVSPMDEVTTPVPTLGSLLGLPPQP